MSGYRSGLIEPRVTVAASFETNQSAYDTLVFIACQHHDYRGLRVEYVGGKRPYVITRLNDTNEQLLRDTYEDARARVAYWDAAGDPIMSAWAEATMSDAREALRVHAGIRLD